MGYFFSAVFCLRCCRSSLCSLYLWSGSSLLMFNSAMPSEPHPQPRSLFPVAAGFQTAGLAGRLSPFFSPSPPAAPPPSRPCVSFNFNDLKGSRCNKDNPPPPAPLPSPSFPNPAFFCFPSPRALENLLSSRLMTDFKKRRAASGWDRRRQTPSRSETEEVPHPTPSTSFHVMEGGLMLSLASLQGAGHGVTASCIWGWILSVTHSVSPASST